MTNTRLGRPARGLPRYYMDVGWYRHPAFAGLPIEALFLFEACVGYCTEHATDGRLPADHEDLAAALGLRASAVKKGLTALLDRGRLVVDGHQVVIDGYEDHNPTAAEIQAHSNERAVAGSLGNHKRWHVERGRIEPDCPHCTPPPDRNSDSQTDRNSESVAIANPSLGMGWDGNAAAEATSDSHSDSPPPAVADPAEAHLDRHIAWRGTAIRNPAGYRRSELGNVRLAAARGDDLEDRWPTRRPAAPTPAHIPGTGRLTHPTPTELDIGTTARGAAIVDLHTRRQPAS